jgi:hypothetical protein
MCRVPAGGPEEDEPVCRPPLLGLASSMPTVLSTCQLLAVHTSRDEICRKSAQQRGHEIMQQSVQKFQKYMHLVRIYSGIRPGAGAVDGQRRGGEGYDTSIICSADIGVCTMCGQ